MGRKKSFTMIKAILLDIVGVLWYENRDQAVASINRLISQE